MNALVAGFAWWRDARVGAPLTRCVAQWGAPPRAPVTGCGVTPVSTHRSHISRPNWELHRKPQWQGSHDGVTPVLAHRSHVSWPHMGDPPKTEGPSGSVRMVASRPFRHTAHTFRGPMGSSSQCPSGRVRIVASRLFHAPHTFHGPMGIFTQGPSGRVRMVASRPFRHTPPTLRGPIRSSTQGHSGRVRMRPPAHFGTPLTRFVAP